MAEMNYLDFDLLIESSEIGYRARVWNSPAGNANSVCPIDSIAKLELSLHRLEADDTDEALLQDLGSQLFEILFVDDATFRASLGQARGEGRGLRVRLRVEPPELAALPWEYLYDPYEDYFLAISPETPLVRYVPMRHPSRPIAVPPPLRVLVVISNPTDVAPLDIEQERDIIQQALYNWTNQGLIQLHVLEHAVVAEIGQVMRSFCPHVFHFVGHGQYQHDKAHVILEHKTGIARPVDEQRFREFFLGIPDTRLAVLNACQTATTSSVRPLTGLSPRILQRNLSAVVAMQYPISDDAALVFSRDFYRSLAQGYPVDAAIAEARKGIFQEVGGGTRDWGTPVLYLRSKDGQLFAPPGEKAREERARGRGATTVEAKDAQTRRKILELLYEASKSDVLDHLSLKTIAQRANTSHQTAQYHLQSLEQQGYVVYYRRTLGPQIIHNYCITPKGREALEKGTL